MGGERKTPDKLSREQIITLYKAGPEAVVSLVQYLQDTVGVFQDNIQILQQNLEQVHQRLRAVEEQLKKNSRNSHKPPSSDGLKKIPKVRKPSGKKPGGQKGHKGTTLQMVENPDIIEVHKVERCGRCGQSLKGKEILGYDRRQVFDLPPIKVEVTEHQAEIKECGRCGTLTTAEFPEEVRNKVQYGPGLKATAAYIKSYGLLSYERAAELFEDLFGVPLSGGTLVHIDREIGERLEEVNERIKEQILDSPIVHFDETGMRIEGKLHWLHVAGTEEATYYMPHGKRGSQAIDAIGILPRFKGIAVHDGWSSYFNYGCDHALCNAHHLRELTFVHEQEGQSWAKQMIEFLLEVKEKKEKSTGQRFSAKRIQEFERRYREIVAMGMAANPPPVEAGKKKRGRKKKSKAANLLDRLRQHEKAVLAFMYDFSVPFNNNAGERDIRMMKVQQKISGTFRSFEGALSFCRIRSYISTVKKQGLNVMAALQDIFSATKLLPELCANMAE
jgi:transposase